MTTSHIRCLIASTVILTACGGARHDVSRSSAAQAAAATALEYPHSPRGEAMDDVHGVRAADPYRWLEALDAPDTQEWIEAQNATTERYLAALPERATIRRLVGALAEVPRMYVPIRAGDKYFLLRAVAGKGQPLLHVQSSLHGASRVLLDVNELEPRGTVELLTLGLAPSPDGSMIAYGTTEGGHYAQTLRIRRVDTGEDLPDHVEGMRAWHWAAWAPDGSGFFYTRQVGPDRPGLPEEQLLFHRLGTPVGQDRVVFHRDGDLPRARVSGDGRYVHVIVATGNEPVNRVYVGDLAAVGADPGSVTLVPLVDTADAAYQVIGSVGSTIYVGTTLEAPRGRIVAIDARNPARENWRTLVPEREHTLPVDPFNPMMRIIGGRLVVRVSMGTHSVMRMYSLDGGRAEEMPLPGIGTVGDFQGHQDHPELLYAFGRFPHLAVVSRYDVRSGVTSPVAHSATPFDADAYETHRITFTSRDGTAVPMFITHRKGISRDGSHPTYLTGYGGFGGTMGPAGDDRLRTTAWLELGGIVAVPLLRGGGELGADWHRAGMFERKQNVFDDFIAAAEYLIREGYTRPEQLAISGQSNGGLLVAAVMVQRPELFAAAVPDVALTDMMRYHLLSGGGAGILEYGVADSPGSARYLYAYSPLHAVREGRCYPATLVTTGVNDPAVHPGHSYKFTAALQHATALARGGGACPPVLLRAEADAGHGGGASASARVDKATDVLAFISASLRPRMPVNGRAGELRLEPRCGDYDTLPLGSHLRLREGRYPHASYSVEKGCGPTPSVSACGAAPDSSTIWSWQLRLPTRSNRQSRTPASTRSKLAPPSDRQHHQ